jgi:hypothetical protein
MLSTAFGQALVLWSGTMLESLVLFFCSFFHPSCFALGLFASHFPFASFLFYYSLYHPSLLLRFTTTVIIDSTTFAFFLLSLFSSTPSYRNVPQKWGLKLHSSNLLQGKARYSRITIHNCLCISFLGGETIIICTTGLCMNLCPDMFTLLGLKPKIFRHRSLSSDACLFSIS